jgi:hypothetical protein
MKPRWMLVLGLAACGGGAAESDKTFSQDGRADWWAPPLECEPTTFYEDLDGDGYGVDGTAVEGETCRPPDRHAELAGDCDDRASSVHPAATELCDGRDNNCDGLVDDDDPAARAGWQWYEDADGDGYGDTSNVVAYNACQGPEGTSILSGDCDDAEPSAHPGRSEDLGDGIDNNCDGLTDRNGNIDGTWTIAEGRGSEPGDRTCEVPWAIDGFWQRELCPDCSLTFQATAANDTGAATTGCEWPFETSFGLHVVDSGYGTLYLAISSYQPGYSYYGYYGYYGYPGYDVFYHYPEATVDWDGTNLHFELGYFDVPVEDGGGTEYQTSGWRFEGTVE